MLLNYGIGLLATRRFFTHLRYFQEETIKFGHGVPKENRRTSLERPSLFETKGAVPCNKWHERPHKVQICVHFHEDRCKFGDRCVNSHQPLPLYKKDLQRMVLRSAAEITSSNNTNASSSPASSSDEVIHEQKNRICSKTSTVRRSYADFGKPLRLNRSLPCCTNRFSVLTVESEDEEQCYSSIGMLNTQYQVNFEGTLALFFNDFRSYFQKRV
jgi:hypothetical protein